MPIYEYVCEACNAKFEKLVRSMSSTDSIDCPSCGQKKAKRQFSAFAVGASASNGTAGGGHGAGCGCCSQARTCPSFQG